MKIGQSRIDEAIGYFKDIRLHNLVKELEQTIPQSDVSKIGKELSLGSRPDYDDDLRHSLNTRQRHAVRALLLCQRVYLSDL